MGWYQRRVHGAFPAGCLLKRYTMKILNVKQSVDIPEGVEASVKSRIVTIKGARGTLKRNFRHLAVDIFMSTPTSITVEKHFGKRKELAAVLRGYKYKMRAVYAHFPINCAISEGGSLVEV